MSDELMLEIKQDLERERDIAFIKKYWLPLLLVIIAILGGVVWYEYSKDENQAISQKAADDYYAFSAFFEDAQNHRQGDSSDLLPTLSEQTLKDVPNYLALEALIRLKHAQKNDTPSPELLEYINAYKQKQSMLPRKTPSDGQTIYDSLIHLMDLAIRTDFDDYETLKKDLEIYLSHPYAFQQIAYELLLLRALEAKDLPKAQEALDILKTYDAPVMQNKIKVYQTHPLFYQAKTIKEVKETDQADENKDKTNISQETSKAETPKEAL